MNIFKQSTLIASQKYHLRYFFLVLKNLSLENSEIKLKYLWLFFLMIAFIACILLLNPSILVKCFTKSCKSIQY